MQFGIILESRYLRYGLWVLVFVAGLGVAWGTRPVQVRPLQLTTLTGESLSIPSQQLTWVNFWSVSCASCMIELPLLEKMAQEYQGRVAVVGVAAAYDPPNAIVETKERLALTMPLALDLNRVAARSFPNNDVVPTHYLVNEKGHILLSLRGEVSEKTMRDALKQHL